MTARRPWLFKHREDRVPVAIAFGLTALDFAVYLSVNSIWFFLVYWLLMMIPKGILSAWNHHHQHAMTFRSPVLNRLLEMSYALHSGMTTNAWVLHHVLGHHVNYLDQTRDESRWKRNSGKTMGVVEYCVVLMLTAYPRAYRVGKRHPKHQRLFVAFTILTFAFLAVLTYYRWLSALFVFILPMVTSILFTAWVTYDHHAGLDTDDPFLASHNIMNRWFNLLTGNLGYHTAHHHQHGLHWSKLPTLHARLADRIPAEMFIPSSFDAFLPGDAVTPPVDSQPPEMQ